MHGAINYKLHCNFTIKKSPAWLEKNKKQSTDILLLWQARLDWMNNPTVLYRCSTWNDSLALCCVFYFFSSITLDTLVSLFFSLLAAAHREKFFLHAFLSSAVWANAPQKRLEITGVVVNAREKERDSKCVRELGKLIFIFV